MIELVNDQLTLSSPETHLDARLIVEFQRTLRMPGGAMEITRLPSLGRYPLYSTEEYRQRVPEHWLDGGGAMLPMYQSEAMWLSLRPSYSVAHQAFYPFAVKIRVGEIDGVRGSRWREGLHPLRQDFLVIQEHSWLGGFQTPIGVQQFVAMPLGTGYLPAGEEEASARFGHLEICAFPMSASAFEMRFPRNRWQERLSSAPTPTPNGQRPDDMGPNALVRQPRHEGLFPFEDWDRSNTVRCRLHLANSLHWCAITGGPPPIAPPRVRPGVALAARFKAVDSPVLAPAFMDRPGD